MQWRQIERKSLSKKNIKQVCQWKKNPTSVVFLGFGWITAVKTPPLAKYTFWSKSFVSVPAVMIFTGYLRRQNKQEAWESLKPRLKTNIAKNDANESTVLCPAHNCDLLYRASTKYDWFSVIRSPCLFTSNKWQIFKTNLLPKSFSAMAIWVVTRSFCRGALRDYLIHDKKPWHGTGFSSN